MAQGLTHIKKNKIYHTVMYSTYFCSGNSILIGKVSFLSDNMFSKTEIGH